MLSSAVNNERWFCELTQSFQSSDSKQRPIFICVALTRTSLCQATFCLLIKNIPTLVHEAPNLHQYSERNMLAMWKCYMWLISSLLKTKTKIGVKPVKSSERFSRVRNIWRRANSVALRWLAGGGRQSDIIIRVWWHHQSQHAVGVLGGGASGGCGGSGGGASEGRNLGGGQAASDIKLTC